jgi:hypothetical protein
MKKLSEIEVKNKTDNLKSKNLPSRRPPTLALR